MFNFLLPSRRLPLSQSFATSSRLPFQPLLTVVTYPFSCLGFRRFLPSLTWLGRISATPAVDQDFSKLRSQHVRLNQLACLARAIITSSLWTTFSSFCEQVKGFWITFCNNNEINEIACAWCRPTLLMRRALPSAHWRECCAVAGEKMWASTHRHMPATFHHSFCIFVHLFLDFSLAAGVLNLHTCHIALNKHVVQF